MAEFSFILDSYISKKGHKIYFRVHHDGRRKKYPTGHYSFPEQWDQVKEMVNKTHPKHKKINDDLEEMLSDARKYLKKCEVLETPFNVNYIFKTVDTSGNFSKFLDKLSAEYKENNMLYSKLAIDTIITQLKQFRSSDIYYSDINKDFISDFNKWLKNGTISSTGVAVKGNSAYTRKLKIDRLGNYYNQAVKDSHAPLPNPFEQFEFKEKQEMKRREWLTDDEINKLEKVELTTKRMKRVRDMYLISVYARGIRFENVLMLKKSDIRNGRLYYTPNKGGKPTSVLLTPNLQVILDKYLQRNMEYIFLPKSPKKVLDREEVYKYSRGNNKNYNLALRKVIEAAGIDKYITFHTARHTFAHKALRTHKNLTIVKELIQHSDESVTRRYAGGFDDEHLDELMNDMYNKGA